ITGEYVRCEHHYLCSERVNEIDAPAESKPARSRHRDEPSRPRPKRRSMAFAIKAEVCDPRAKTFAFVAQKTMYGGKHIAQGDTIFVFASENEGGQGMIARGVVTSVEAVAKKRGVARQTPRVSLTVRRTALAKRPLGRNEIKPFTDWDDGQPATELNFKFY